MHRHLKGYGLAAVILFAPGGFLLGAALGADYLRRRHAEARLRREQ